MKLVRAPDLSLSFAADGRLIVKATSRGRAARVPAMAVAVLDFCHEPRDAGEVEQAMGPPGVRLFDGLAQAGMLVSEADAGDTPVFFDNFAHVDVHRRMLADAPRLDAYQAALREVVSEGDVVADAGTGSGVLACMAAQAGARRVLGIDRSDLLEVAADIAERSGLSERVSFIRGDLRTVELPEQVNVIVTETFGAFGLAEGAPEDVAALASRHLVPGGVVVPSVLELWLAPLCDPAPSHEALAPFAPHHGIDFGPLGQAALRRGITQLIDPKSLAHPGLRVAALPFPDPGEVLPSARLDFGEPGGAELTGFVGWFVLQLSPSVRLDTGPHHPATHWKQVLLPMEPISLVPGANLVVDIRINTAPDDRRALVVDTTWQLGEASGQLEHRIR